MKRLALIAVLCLLSIPSVCWPDEKFNPVTQCSSSERGTYPFNYRAIVDKYIGDKYFDPTSIIDLKVHAPDPS